MKLFYIVLLLCVVQCIATSSERVHIAMADSDRTKEIPDLNFPPPPESVRQEKANLPTKSQIKNMPKGMTPEQFRMKETERKRRYRKQKGQEWNRMKWRKADAVRREKNKKFANLGEARKIANADSVKRSRAREKAKKLGIPETPDIALRVPKKQKLNDALMGYQKYKSLL